MKKETIVICLATIYAGCCIGYSLGKSDSTKKYANATQVASIMTTCCNNMVDNLGTEAEEIYYEYIDNLDCYNLTITEKDIAKYNAWH